MKTRILAVAVALVMACSAPVAAQPAAQVAAAEDAFGTLRAKLGPLGEMTAEMTFEEATKLARLAEAKAKQAGAPNLKGEFELVRWRAVEAALVAMWGQPDTWDKEPVAGWLASLGEAVYLDEIQGTYLLAIDTVWTLADTYKGLPIADDITFFAATLPMGGECEGSMACYAEATMRQEGEYVRRFPQGRHIGPALERVAATLEAMVADWPEQVEDRQYVDLAAWAAMLKPAGDSDTARRARQSLAKLSAMK